MRIICFLLLASAVVALFAGCAGDDDDAASTGQTDDDDNNDDDDDDDSLEPDCNGVTGLFSVADTLDSGTGDCYDWVSAVCGRAILDSIGSAAIFTRNNDYGLGLMLGAVHTLGEGYLGASGTDLPAEMVDPSEQYGVARIQLVPPDGALETDYLSAMFFFFHPELPAEENDNQLKDILPRHDFYASMVDSQLFEQGLTAPMPGPLVLAPLPLYDPMGLTLSDPVIRNPEAGELVLMTGYPRDGELAGMMAASVGRTLSDDEAQQAILKLKQAGDVEGQIDYDPESEFLIEGEALVGMSGSGTFDLDGNQIGVLVRASDKLENVQYIRAVRTTFIMETMMATYDQLSAEEKEIAGAFLPDLAD